MPSTQEIQKKVQDESGDNSFYLKKIKELENALEAKEKENEKKMICSIVIKNLLFCFFSFLSITMSKLFFHFNLDENKIEKILELSLNCVKLFATREQICEIPLFKNQQSKDDFVLSVNFPSVVVTREKKIAVDSYINDTTESNTSVFRKLMGVLIPRDEVWALRDKERMKTDFSDEILASYGNVL